MKVTKSKPLCEVTLKRLTKSSGIGEFLDLIPLANWCASLGFDTIQLLPLNDSGFESSPYNALSSLALNPVYLSLWSLPFVQDDEFLSGELVRFKKYKSLQRIPYEAINNAKFHFLRLYHNAYFSNFKEMPEYLEYLSKHDWLIPYALFKVLKDDNAHINWQDWEKNLRDPSSSLLKKLSIEYRKELDFYIFLQYLCYKQLTEAKAHANQKGIFLKGDIPILISPESLDVWLNREDFDLSVSVGSPPDSFSKEGQNWGFPSYRWNTIEENHYSWWKNRLQTASEYYDIFRVDHIVGFYRLWIMERGSKASEGFFNPQEHFAMIIQGERVLKQLLSFTDMLPIGEDLSVDIEHIRKSMLELGIPGTRIPRWERNFKTDNSFINEKEYPEFSLTTLSTHDSETISQWWKNNPEEVKQYCKDKNIPYTKEISHETRYNLLHASHNSSSLFHINMLNEYLALFPDLVWENLDDERVNLPGTVLPSNWCYRMRPTLEEISSHESLASAMRSLIN